MSLDKYVMNVRHWPDVGSKREGFYIAERVPDCSTIVVEPKDYEFFPYAHWDGRAIYKRREEKE